MEEYGKGRSIRVGMVGCEDLPKWGGADCNQLCAEIFEARGFGRPRQGQSKDSLVDMPVATDSSHCDIFSAWESPSIDWVYFDAVTGLLPKLDELLNFDGFILTGSHYSAYEPLEWISKYEEWIRELARFQKNNSKPPRVFAVCFSHQAVNKALGGTVGRNPHGKFVWNMEDVKLNHNAQKHPFFKGLVNEDNKISYALFESHGDSVTALAPIAEHLATSDTSNFEIVSIGDDIISIQSHPEFSEYEMVDKILPSLKRSGIITDEDAERAMANFKSKQDARKILKLLERYFSRME